MNRLLIQVVNRHQLLFAICLKKSVFFDQIADIVLVGDKFEYIDKSILKTYFAEIFELERYNIFRNYAEVVLSFVNPRFGFSRLIDINIEDYSDYFFWNPGWLLYFIYKYSVKKRLDIRWHLIADGCGPIELKYPTSVPLNMYSAFVGGKIFDFIDRKKYRFGCFDNWNLDSYIWGKNLIQFDKGDMNIYDCPPVNMKDTELLYDLKNLFKVSEINIKEKYIFLDTCWTDTKDGATVYPMEEVIKLLDNIVDIVGEDNFIVKAHPRIDKSVYNKARHNIKVMEEDIPWEMVCLVADISDKVVISVFTSSFIMQYLMFGNLNVTYCVDHLLRWNNNWYNQMIRCRNIMDLLAVSYGKFIQINDYNELENVLV